MNKISKSLFLSVVMLALVFGGTGCITFKKTTTAPANLGGVFMTNDRFETWQHQSALMTPGEIPGTIAETDISFMMFDPSDSEAIYAGTRGHGLLYSYERGTGWQRSKKLPEGVVRDLAIDTKDKCTLYAAVNSKIYKSEDCTRTWKQIYFTDNVDKVVSALAVDWFKPNVVYAGLSDGGFLQSMDYGTSWKLAHNFPQRVMKIKLDYSDSRRIYVGLLDGGMYRKEVDTEEWTDMNIAMRDFSGAISYYDFDLSRSTAGMIIYANRYGLLKSLDFGDTWQEVKLVTSPGSERIYSIAIDPINSNYIYYSTNTMVYKTLDGGVNWIPKEVPTTRVVSELLIHPVETANIFIGTMFIEQ